MGRDPGKAPASLLKTLGLVLAVLWTITSTAAVAGFMIAGGESLARLVVATALVVFIVYGLIALAFLGALLVYVGRETAEACNQVIVPYGMIGS